MLYSTYMVKAIPLVKNYGPVKKRGSWTLRQKFIGFNRRLRRDPSNITLKCQRQESLRDSVTKFSTTFLKLYALWTRLNKFVNFFVFVKIFANVSCPRSWIRGPTPPPPHVSVFTNPMSVCLHNLAIITKERKIGGYQLLKFCVRLVIDYPPTGEFLTLQ